MHQWRGGSVDGLVNQMNNSVLTRNARIRVVKRKGGFEGNPWEVEYNVVHTEVACYIREKIDVYIQYEADTYKPNNNS